jgi:hypothetical protein
MILRDADYADLAVLVLVIFLWHASKYSDWWLLVAFLAVWAVNCYVYFRNS